MAIPGGRWLVTSRRGGGGEGGAPGVYTCSPAGAAVREGCETLGNGALLKKDGPW